jgi:hypothetical protein
MVKGLDIFREHFRQFEGFFTLIGGAACVEWLRLTKARDEGQTVDAKNITKHRGDVFRLAATIPRTSGPVLHPSIAADLASFLAAFPEDSPEWPDILKSIKATVGTTLPPSTLRNAIQTYFGIMRDDEK